jgi:hypothetical protein
MVQRWRASTRDGPIRLFVVYIRLTSLRPSEVCTESAVLNHGLQNCHLQHVLRLNYPTVHIFDNRGQLQFFSAAVKQWLPSLLSGAFTPSSMLGLWRHRLKQFA